MFWLGNSINLLISETVLTWNNAFGRRVQNQAIHNNVITLIKQIPFPNNRNNGTICKLSAV